MSAPAARPRPRSLSQSCPQLRRLFAGHGRQGRQDDARRFHARRPRQPALKDERVARALGMKGADKK